MLHISKLLLKLKCFLTKLFGEVSLTYYIFNNKLIIKLKIRKEVELLSIYFS